MHSGFSRHRGARSFLRTRPQDVLRPRLVRGYVFVSVLICASGWAADNSSNIPATANQQAPPALSATPKSPVTELYEMEHDATREDLRAALTNAVPSERAYAIKAISYRADKTFLTDLSKALQDDRAKVRVEAALALNAFGDPTGKDVLASEMIKARQAQTKFASGKQAPTFWDIEDMNAWLRAAGALASLGNSNGYDLVSAAVTNSDRLRFGTFAALEIPKFTRFKDRRPDAERLLLWAADDAVSRIHTRLAENPNRRPAGAIGEFDVISRMLAQVGGEQEIAKLKLYAQDQNPDVRGCALAYLHAIEHRENAHQSPSDQQVPDLQKGQSP